MYRNKIIIIKIHKIQANKNIEIFTSCKILSVKELCTIILI